MTSIQNMNIAGLLSCVGGVVSCGWGAYDCFSALCHNEPRRYKSGCKKILLGVAGIAAAAAIRVWVGIKEEEIREFERIFNQREVVFDRPLPQESTTCSVDALKNIFAERQDSTSSALFASFDCQNFLPWNAEFKERYKAISGIKLEHLTQSEMWGITPTKNPFISMGGSAFFAFDLSDAIEDKETAFISIGQDERILGSKEELLTLVLDKDYLAVICDNIRKGKHDVSKTASVGLLEWVNVKLLNRDFTDSLFAMGCSSLKDQYLALIQPSNWTV